MSGNFRLSGVLVVSAECRARASYAFSRCGMGLTGLFTHSLSQTDGSVYTKLLSLTIERLKTTNRNCFGTTGENCMAYDIFIGVGRFRILGGGCRILGGARGDQIPSRHMTSY